MPNSTLMTYLCQISGRLYELFSSYVYIDPDYAMSLFESGMNRADALSPAARVDGRNDVILLDGKSFNGVTTVVYQRSLDA